ncbi:MAG TPA: SGNH/GDSL hydrolase family protein [Gaiellaceae bacterium]|jgi:lysophospholipase L1-like esterase|nr:SGNH/GDSL hydrolase family protein [Gaiellaceae bacterium]
MRATLTVRRRVLALAAAATVVAVAAAISAGTVLADPVNGSDANGTYLALGDSVAFGYVPPNAVPAPNYVDAHSFVGYPEYLAQQLNERVSNASCPGETTASMLVAGAQSNGCENSLGSPVGYSTLYPLHVQYRGTQMDYALHYLAAHKHTRLVTIDVGANDAFLCQETTADHCTSGAELFGVANEIAANLATIFHVLRVDAGYTGPIVALTYYSLSYSDPAAVAGTQFLNSVIAGVATASGGIVADGLAAFQGPSLAFGGDPCAAGLLIKLPNGTCNIHPSAAGHRLLAAAIATAIGA